MAQRQSSRQTSCVGLGSSEGRIAAYIADLVEEMERLARQDNLPQLCELLAAARKEARRHSWPD